MLRISTSSCAIVEAKPAFAFELSDAWKHGYDGRASIAPRVVSLGEYACVDDEADWNNASIIQIDCG
jgi:hypothetical protein